MDIKQALAALLENKNLTEGQMQSVMRSIMTGNCTDAQIAGFLMALRCKGETIDEIVGAVKVMRELATPVVIEECVGAAGSGASHLVDIVGTGGDGANLFNVSTASSFVAAAAGARVAKHGNRSVSSSSGSADVLEYAGVKLGLPAEQVAACVNEIGVGFMFAPAHHSAMKFAIGPRKEMAVRTIFNVLGPMTNPANVQRMVMGVFSKDLLRPLAEVLQRLGMQHVMVVHSQDGLDELSVCAKNYVAELKNGEIAEYILDAADYGLPRHELKYLAVHSSKESFELIKTAFTSQRTGESVAAADMIALNAGAAIYVSGVASTLQQGIAMAQDAIATGLANQKILELAEFTTVAAVALEGKSS